GLLGTGAEIAYVESEFTEVVHELLLELPAGVVARYRYELPRLSGFHSGHHSSGADGSDLGANQVTRGLQPLPRKPVRCEVRWNALLLRDLEHGEHGVIDLVGLSQCALLVPVAELAVHVDHAAGVGNVVRSIENPAALERLAVPLLEKLVVGRACDDLDSELRNGVVVDDAAKRTWGEDVALNVVDLARVHGACTGGVHHALHSFGIHVGHRERGAGLVQLASQVVTHVAAPLQDYMSAGEVIAAPARTGRCLDGPEHAVSGDGRRIAGSRGETDHVVGLHVHEIHVHRGRAHVLRRYVASA